MTTRKTQRKNGAALAGLIVESLLREPKRSVDMLAAELGFGDSAVRLRLTTMLNEGRAKFTEVRGQAAFARLKLWEIVDPALCPVEVEEKPDLGAGAVPRQATARKYPPINRRDPLVACLFGPARQAHEPKGA